MFFSDEGEEIIRIISARRATVKERKAYEKCWRESKIWWLRDVGWVWFFWWGSGRFYEPKKVPTTMRLDNDILLFLKKHASERKIAYQTLINNLLREYMKKSL